MMRQWILFILSFAVSLTATAQDVEVRAALDSSDIYIGDQAEYTITVTQPPGIRLTIPEYTDTLHRNLEILSQSAIDTSYEESGEIRLRKSYIITSFDTGYYMIPPFYLEYETGQGKKMFFSDYVPLRVRRVDISPPDSSDVIFDIIGPEQVPYGAGEIVPWVLLVIIIGIAAWLLYRYLPRRKKSEEEDKGPAIPAEAIHIITFRELDKLEKQMLWQAAKIKEYYSRLTEILRYYIEIRYNIRALEMTSEEILSALAGIEPDENHLSVLRQILQNADLSKFARYKHDDDTNRSAMALAREFVKLTYMREQVSGTEEGKEVSDE
ncbi:MAG: hypothetical protein KFF49_04310 [Bacteroidales bacterium]|nr:hypothetical protein [Bacteroidales bacterium]